MDPGAGLLHDLPAHGARPRPATDRPLRHGGVMSNRHVETRTIRTAGAPRTRRLFTLNLILLGVVLLIGIALPTLGASSFMFSLTYSRKRAVEGKRVSISVNIGGRHS